MGDVEEIQEEVERLLRKCSDVELPLIATHVKVTEEEFRDKPRRDVLRSIQNAFDVIQEGEQKMSMFAELKSVLPTKLHVSLENILNKIHEVKPEVEPTDRVDDNDKKEDVLKILQGLGLSANLGSSPASMYRRQLKITGNIGDSQKEINYINLCSQINEAKAIGYKAEEIVAAVKKAILPGTGLRTYFDSQDTISLDNMLKFLRNYFQEKSPTELFNTLNSLCQGEDEEASTFLLRALEVRQKVICRRNGEIR